MAIFAAGKILTSAKQMANAFRLVSYCMFKECNNLFTNSKFKPLLFFVRHRPEIQIVNAPRYLFFNRSFLDENEKAQLLSDIKVFEGFITEDEENSLLEELEPRLKRMRYESSHWDNAIKRYRETERLKWNPANFAIIEKVRKLAFGPHSVPLKHVHVLDLEENGVIMPHIDSVKFCGTTIAGISLLSDSVMRLIHDKDKKKVLDVLLERRSLYIMTGVARYNYTHEILGNENSKFGDRVVKKQRRISIICRNEPQ